MKSSKVYLVVIYDPVINNDYVDAAFLSRDRAEAYSANVGALGIEEYDIEDIHLFGGKRSSSSLVAY
ncbi:MAG: hypothetical protein K9L30_14810 [Desulfobacterales bacterium]|nr:hypothetical protein [Desulfobacterales bacterium]